MRLIDADELKERAHEMILEDPDAFNGGWSCDAVTVDEIDESPTIEAQPIVYAEWIGTRYDGFADGYPVYDAWECSVCGEEYESEGEPPTCNFCPNCGAKIAELN